MIQGKTGMPPDSSPDSRDSGWTVAGPRPAAPQQVSGDPHDHLVQFYEDPAWLLESVSAWLRAGLAAGETAVAIALPEHRSDLERRLEALGVDVPGASQRGDLVLLDAAGMLARFMVDGWPDEARFEDALGSLISAGLEGRPGLRAFGEMVAILWARGQGEAALRLESLWNGLGRSRSFSLFCAYPMKGFRGANQGEAFARVCREHSHVLAPDAAQGAGSAHGASARPAGRMRPRVPAPEDGLAERRSAEDAYRRLAAIVESSFDAIISKDLDGIITSWNMGAERLFGYGAAEAVGRPVSMLLPPERQSEEPLNLGRIRAGDRVEPYDTVRLRKDGRRVEVSLTVSPIRDCDGRIVGASKILRDITDRKRFESALAEKEEQLRQAQKMEAVGRLAGGIAHDFNNLLTAINGYSEMALAMAAEDAALEEFLQEIRRAGERAASLTQQLLAYSRKQILAPTVFSLNRTVAEMDRMLRRLIGEDVEINCVLDPDLAPVRADTGQVQQILLNLVVNARDAMPDGGRLTIETANVDLDEGRAAALPEASAGAHVMLAVTDTGVGMDEALQARIFEPFFTTKGVGKGTGLGLSSVYGIVKQSGGTIAVESAPGKGSVFRIYLPAAVPEEKAAPAPPLPSPGAAIRPLESVLVVEDEETVRRFVQRTLGARGYSVRVAKDGAEALAMGGREGAIDLLVTDLVMPNLNGSLLAERLKALHPRMRVLFMSGYPDNALQPDSAPDRATRFLQKPFGQSGLLQAVRETLDQPRRIPVGKALA